jgi:preprotein translocase subunit SecE
MNFLGIAIFLLVAAIAALLLGYAMVGYILLAAIVVTLLLRYRVTLVKFVGEVKVELDKCSWPWDPNQTGLKKYKELIESTVVVIISVVLLAGFVTSCDWILAHLVGALTGTAIMK